MISQGQSSLAVTMLLGVILLVPLAAAAQNDRSDSTRSASVTVHHRFCPQGYSGQTFYEDCHGDIGLVGIPFFVSEIGQLDGYHDLAWTDAKGNASFTDIPAGAYRINREGEFQRFPVPYIFCANAANPGVERDSTVYTPNWIGLRLDPGDKVICDWYTEFPVGWRLPVANALPVTAYLCEDVSTSTRHQQGEIPPNCRPAVGVAINAIALDGTLLGSCTTDTKGFCWAPVPRGLMIHVEEDVSTLPPGYQPRENPVTTWDVTEFAGAGFSNVHVPPDLIPTPGPRGA